VTQATRRRKSSERLKYLLSRFPTPPTTFSLPSFRGPASAIPVVGKKSGEIGKTHQIFLIRSADSVTMSD
jgi:hypothetical protein